MAKPNLVKRLKVLELVNQGLYLSNISKVLKVRPVSARKLIKKLEKEGYLKQITKYPAFYELTPKGRLVLLRKSFKPTNFNQFSPPMSDRLKSSIFTSMNLHDFKVKIPILKKGKLLENTKKTKINNWVKEYLHLELPYPLTLEITTKSVILHFRKVELPKGIDFYQALFKFFTIGLVSVVSYLHTRGFRLDLFNLKVISQHIANQTNKDIDNRISDNTVVEVELNHIAKSVLGKELGNKQGAKAWIDKSQNIAEVETNDLTYEENLILMPERIAKMESNLALFFYGMDKYNKNIELHLSVLKQIREEINNFSMVTRKLTKVLGNALKRNKTESFK